MVNHSLEFHPGLEGWWCVIHKHKIFLAAPADKIPNGQFSELNLPFNDPKLVHEIGEFEASPVYMFHVDEQEFEQVESEFTGLRQILYCQSEMFEFAARAFQVHLFLDTHKYCGRCGKEMDMVDWELAMHCQHCQHRCYPRISPCVIVAVRSDKQILLAQGKRSTTGSYSVLAGFVESGETLEQAAHREVFEEVGVKIKNLKYHSSQPWPFPHSLMAGFTAEYDEGEINICEDEILAADWFDPDDLPKTPASISIAGQLIATTLTMLKR